MSNPQKHKKIIRDSIQGITKPAIRRLAKRGGNLRLSGMVYEEVRGIMKVYMENILSNAILLMQHARRKTLHKDDLEGAVEVLGIYLVAGPKKKGTSSFDSSKARHKQPKETEGSHKPHRFKPGTVSKREVTYQQKTSETFAIRKTNFIRLTKEIGQNYSEDIRYGRTFMEFFQLVVEDYLISLLSDAHKIANHTEKRQTLFPKDLQLARTIRGDRN